MFNYENIEKLNNKVIDESYLNTRPVTIPEEKAKEIINNLKNISIKDIFKTIPKESVDYITNFIKGLTPNVLENYKNY